MKIRALTSFSGKAITMYKGEVREVADKSLLEDYLNAGFIEEVASSTNEAVKEGEDKSLLEDYPNAGFIEEAASSTNEAVKKSEDK